MPYKKVEPVPESWMKRQKYDGHHTICQTLREIWATTDNEEVKLKCRVAMAMAKKMQDKLKEYYVMFHSLNKTREEAERIQQEIDEITKD